MTRYWKVLDANGRSCHGGSFQWSLPRWDNRKGWIPGEWTPVVTNLVPYVRGYHVCRDEDLLDWLGPRIYACEVRGAIVPAGNKVVVESVRLTCPTPWDDCAARLFAAECARLRAERDEWRGAAWDALGNAEHAAKVSQARIARASAYCDPARAVSDPAGTAPTTGGTDGE